MAKSDSRSPYIGSFVLETLTTGMYGESRNALREYVQNASDAVAAAVSSGVLRERAAKVEVLLKDEDTLIIHDNGIGIGAASAWGTLTAIGASKKDRKRDAGFRGIGRLAGIAFCDSLSFRTKAAGESSETTVTFNCVKLREGMNPESGGGKPLVDLLSEAVSSTTNDDVEAEEHYMEVSLSGLSRAPEEFKELDLIKEYLAETAPIGYDPKWEWGKKIKAKADELKKPLDIVRLHVGRTSQDAKPVYKRYRDSYPAKDDAVTLTDVEFLQSEKWWMWVGLPDRAFSITDPTVHGLRIRVKNIQVGGPEHLDAVFGRRGQSYIRFNRYYVGEIHVSPTALIPNARRDGFEDDDAWEDLRTELYTKLKYLGTRAHKLSDDRQKSLETIEKKVEGIQEDFDQLDLEDPESEDRTHLLSKTLRVRSALTKALTKEEMRGEVRLQLRSHLAEMNAIKGKLEGKSSQQDARSLRATIRKEVIEQILDLVKPYLEPPDFAQVKKQINEKVR
ncbi:MAG: ATP-binding protein [Acidobacteria bacterium]|nr:ATP-binding protein [Acidobacteriota bacterium]